MIPALNFNRIVWDKKTVSAVVVVTVALLYGDIAFLMRMQLNSLSTMGPKIKRLKKDTLTLDRDLAVMRLAQQEEQKQKQEPVPVKKLLNASEFPLLMDKISLLGNAPGMKIMQIESVKPKEEAPPPVPRGSKLQPAQPVPQAAPNIDASFNVTRLFLDLSCDYHSLGVFLNRLDELPAVFFIEELAITPDTNVREDVRLVLKVYVNK